MAETKSWWDIVKGAVIEEDTPKAAPAAPQGARTSAPPVIPSGVVLPAPVVGAAAFPVVADPAALSKLEATLQASLPPAYATFSTQFETFKTIIPDETMRVRAALAASGATVAQLSGAIDQLLGVMARSRSDFNSTFEARRGTMIASAQANVANADQQIQAREAQIEAMRQEVSQLRAQREAAARQIQEDEAHLQAVQQGFEGAYATVVDRLNQQKSRIAAMPQG